MFLIKHWILFGFIYQIKGPLHCICFLSILRKRKGELLITKSLISQLLLEILGAEIKKKGKNCK